MSKFNHSSTEADSNVNVTVKVDVAKIIRNLCVAGVLIVGIIFGTRTFKAMLDKGLVR